MYIVNGIKLNNKVFRNIKSRIIICRRNTNCFNQILPGRSKRSSLSVCVGSSGRSYRTVVRYTYVRAVYDIIKRLCGANKQFSPKKLFRVYVKNMYISFYNNIIRLRVYNNIVMANINFKRK